MKLCKLLLAVVGATVLLGALVGTASARNLSSSSTTFRATWTSAEFTGGIGTTRCNLTLEGTLRSATIAKTRGAEIGSITNGSIGTCPAGSATILKETLPWRVQYDSFTGTLPNITSIRTNTINSAFRVTESAFQITCLARSNAEHPATGTFNLNASHAVTSVTLGGEGIPCEGATGGLRGTSSTNSAQTITLI